MAQTAATLCDSVLPLAPYRQWTLSLPWHHRLRLARNDKLLTACLRATTKTIFTHQRKQARKRNIVGAQCGSVTFIHRFDSQLRLNVHLHLFAPDGVFARDETGAMAFHPLPAPTDKDVKRVTQRVSRRIEQLIALDIDDGADADDDAMASAVAEASRASGGSLFVAPPVDAEPPQKPRCAVVDGYSLRADVGTAKNDRQGLERMLRYGARPPLAQSRLRLRDDGKVPGPERPFRAG